MALWGNNDSVYADGTVTVDYSAKTVTGSGTTFTSGNGVEVGQVITITGHGSAVISEQPVYLVEDTNWGQNEIYGVDKTEVGVAATTEFAVAHSGWVGMTTYVDTHGNLRVKHEVIVAGSITGDADTDDTKFADS